MAADDTDRRDGRVARAERLRSERRGQVLDAARTLFSERGYHATSVNDIIEAAGIARGTFYLYFESKRAIFDELLDGFFATLWSTVRRIDTSPGAPSPFEQMRSTVDQLFDVLQRERAMARILMREAVGLDPDFDRKLSDFYGRLAVVTGEAVKEGVAMGLVRPCDAEVAAWSMLGAIKEVIHQYLVRTQVSDDEERRRIGGELLRFVLSAVLNAPPVP